MSWWEGKKRWIWWYIRLGIPDRKLFPKSDSASCIFPLLFILGRTDCNMWFDSQLEDYLLSVSPTHTNSLTSAAKAQLLGSNAVTARMPLFLSSCAIRRPYSVHSAYHQSLVAEPTVVPSPGIPQAHYPHKHDECKRFECETVGGWKDGTRRQRGGLLLLPRSHEEHEVHLLWTTTQITHQRTIPTRWIRNENAEIKYVLWREAAVCKTENNLHTRGDDASGIFLFLTVYKLDV